MQDELLRIHRFEPSSRANGPGRRAVVWVQGCSLGCPGCFNPETHAAGGGEKQPVDRLAHKILSLRGAIEGLTISGGEPMHQHRALARLARQVRQSSDLSVLVFTGYRWEELMRFPGVEDFLAEIDVLIAGRYDPTRRVANGLIGSENKTVHFLSPRYTQADLDAVPQAEILLSPDGEIVLSGIDPLEW